MKGYADLIQAVSSLLWPVFAFVALLVFRRQIGEVIGQFRQLKKGKFFGTEVEFVDSFDQDEGTKIIHEFLFPGGIYDDQRRKTLNGLLRELGISRDVRLILVGAEGASFRKQLIEHAKKKGLSLVNQSLDRNNEASHA